MAKLSHVKLFEQFVNEKINMKKTYKEFKKNPQNSNRFNSIEFHDGIISVETEPGDNPWGDDHEYTFYWDGESVWCDTDFSDGQNTELITTLDQFDDAINFEDGWE